MKILKIGSYIIGLFILALIAAIIVLSQLVNPNDYRDEITTITKEQTGLNLTIEGDLSLSVFPWLGIKTGRVALSQPQDIAKSGDFVNVGQASIKVKLKPLFSRKIAVDTVLLDQPKIHLIINKQGVSSIDSIMAKVGGNEEAEQQKPSSSSSNNAKAIAALTVAGINITNGQLTYDDRQTNTRYDLNNLNITSGDLLSNKAAPVNISGKVTGNDIEPVNFSLDTDALLNKDALEITLTEVITSVTQGSIELNTRIEALNYQHQSASNQMRNINFSGTAEGIKFSLDIPEVKADLNKTVINIPSLNLEALGIKIAGSNIVAKSSGDAMTVKGKLQTNTFNGKGIIDQFNIDYVPTNPAALSKISFSSAFNASPNGLSLQGTAINLDESRLDGDLSIVNFADPGFRFDLNLNQIVVDDYLPKTDPATNTTSNDEAPISATEALVAPIAGLQGINANGVFRAQNITANKLKLNNTQVTVASNKNTVTITPKVELYKGKLDGKLTLQKTATPTLTIVKKLSNVELGPLLTDAEITDQFSGTGNIDTNIKVVQSQQPTSKGTVRIVAKNGAIKGVDIKQILDNAQNFIDKLRGKSANNVSGESTDETRFAEMSATLLLNNDIINNNDLSIKAPLFRIKGEGSVNTKAQNLDYLTSVVVVNTNSGQGGQSRDSLKGFTIPVRFTGPLTAPDYKIDTKALIKANTAQAVAKEKEELKAKARAKALDKLGIKSTNANGQAKTTAQAKEEVKKELKQKAEDQIKDKLKDKLKGWFK